MAIADPRWPGKLRPSPRRGGMPPLWQYFSCPLRTGDSFRGCCPALNFFASAENGERWLDQHPEVRGQVVSMAEAVAAGRAVFGDVLS